MTRLSQIIDAIDRLNAEDPNLELEHGKACPSELLYSRRMTAQLLAFMPDASEELQIAARAQHIQRWQVPRQSYPEGRIGYLQWRTDLGRMHAKTTRQLMAEHDYSEAAFDRVQRLLTKRGIKSDAEVQTLEDVICLVFLQYYLADFAAKHPQDKVLDIIRKTWHKMSPAGQTAALALHLPADSRNLVNLALAA